MYYVRSNRERGKIHILIGAIVLVVMVISKCWVAQLRLTWDPLQYTISVSTVIREGSRYIEKYSCGEVRLIHRSATSLM